MQIKEVCEMFDLTPDTLRYYEKVGLIGEVARDENGYRIYSEKNLDEIYFSKILRTAGIPVQVLAHYLQLIQEGDKSISERKGILLTERENIRQQIENLQDTLDYLDGKIANYDGTLLTYERDKLMNQVNKFVK